MMMMTIYQDWLISCDSSKHKARGRGLFSLYIYKENFKNLLVRNHWTDFNKLSRNVPLMTIHQDLSSCCDSLKSTSTRVWGLFFLHIYTENLKNLLVRNCLTSFCIIWQKCSFGDPLSSCSIYHNMSKSTATKGRDWFTFLIYLCRKTLKNLLVRNHWTDFNIIWQKCSFGHPLPRLYIYYIYIYIPGLRKTGKIASLDRN